MSRNSEDIGPRRSKRLARLQQPNDSVKKVNAESDSSGEDTERPHGKDGVVERSEKRPKLKNMCYKLNKISTPCHMKESAFQNSCKNANFREHNYDQEDTKENEDKEMEAGHSLCRRRSMHILRENSPARESDPKAQEEIEDEDTFYCEICDYCSSMKNLNVHMKTHTRDKSFVCSMCEKTFENIKNLKRHILIHRSKKTLQCDTCGVSFLERWNLIAHMRIHSGEKPFKCSVCKAAFSQSAHLKRHKKMHTNDKPYKCEICDARFAQKYNLKPHMRVHNGERPYTCDICKASFTQSCHLKTHMFVHSGERRFKCEICDSAFILKAHLKTHMQTHFD